MGTVYLAEDHRLARHPCAIKEMSPGQLSPQDRSWATHAFQQEAQMLAKLNHAGLVRVSDYFEEGGNWYLVMDYVPGQTLEAWLEQTPGRFLPSPIALNYVEQLCEVLDYLHHQQPPVVFQTRRAMS
jgi:serine/threonine protein kinase